MAAGGENSSIVRRGDGTRVGIWGLYEIRTAFQPIFRFNPDAKLTISAFECLVRPFRAGNPVSPHQFFASVPEESRFEVERLTRNMHLLNAGACLDPAAAVFLNFDPSLFSRREMVAATLIDMRLVLAEAGIDPGRIVCELTEQGSVSEEILRALIRAMRAHGHRIAVDDFGAEDSDFERITALRPDIVKFDAAWIGKLMRSASGYGLLKSMIGRLTDLGIETVIEGIEESWQLELTEMSGAGMVQGFGLARPQIMHASDNDRFGIRDAWRDSEPPAPAAASVPDQGPTDMKRERVFGRRR